MKNLILTLLLVAMVFHTTKSVKYLDMFKGFNALSKNKNPIDTIGNLIDMGEFQKGLVDILSKMGEETENTAQAVVNIPNQVVKQISDFSKIDMYYAFEKMDKKVDEKLAAVYFEN